MTLSKLYLNLGLQLKKNSQNIRTQIRIILKPYIERNTKLQREGEKEGYKLKKKTNAKLRDNVVFGKSKENPMNNGDVKIVITRKQYLKWSFRPTFKR